jgi:type VI secretion system protein ImpE
MSAEQSLRDGRPQEALEQVQQQVRREPAAASHRVFLFQLLATLGQWERALTQLKVLKDLSSDALVMVHTYQTLIHCEQERAQIFAGQRAPMIFGEPEQWIALLLQALQLLARNRHAEAAELRDQALAAAPATSGSIDGQAFAWLADADTRLGPVLEAMVNGHYYWIPIHRIQRIALAPPSDLRDLVWQPVQFTWANAGQAVGMIPVRYPGSEASTDGAVQLARRTEWQEQGSEHGHALGLGQRLLATDQDDYPLLDTRLIELDTAVPEETGNGTG